MICSLKTPAASFLGEGSVSNVKVIIEREKTQKVIVFTDKTLRAAGICDVLLEQLQGVSYEIIDDIKPEPSYLDVEAAAKSMEQCEGDLIIAIGGGSVMDTAKLCSILRGAPYGIKDLLVNPGIAKKYLKTVMLPTTCGTGSEATCNAIVAIPEESVKKGIANEVMIPEYAILDPLMIAKLPKPIVAATGADALAHTVECYTSLKANAFSNLYALQGAKLIFENIAEAYQNPDNMEARTAMMLGAFYGGIAITASGTTAVHALSYPLGGKFHIAHGVSNAILFAPVMEYNRSACEKELAEICDAIRPECFNKTASLKSHMVIDEIRKVIRETSIPGDLKMFGVTMGDIDFLVESGSQQRRLLDNNRKNLTKDEIRSIYEQVVY